MKLDLSFIGRNIRKLRQQRNWSMAKLAARVGMNEVPLGRIERGLNAPSASVIYRLSKELGVSVDTLFAVDEHKFRSLKHESSQAPFPATVGGDDKELPSRIITMSHDIIEAFCALEDICKAQKRANIPLVIPFDPTIRGMEALSEKVRCFAGIEHGIVFDYFELFETLGFRVIVVPLPKKIESFSYYDPLNQNAFFFLTTRQNPEKQLFCLAYELGNVLILTYSIQQGVELFHNDAASDSSGEKPFTAHRAARRFAATFLMPAKAVRDTVEQLGIQKKHWSYELLLRIKHRFGVSVEAFLYRLNELDLIHPSLVQPLKAKIHEHYGKTDFGEPDLSRRLLTPNGRLWDLVLTGKESKEGREEVLEIEKVLKKWKVVKK
ncbi:MAG: XRE family transcriptional regulator [Deltaproteobacteria bacterium]|jgi:transcriptional regulator with XRE-family HTH domain/Zn-dependent peptidase ImmA (M78 family)|nr:XRE family transcriptional regulator [Deltaproteobacteria bacterium]